MKDSLYGDLLKNIGMEIGNVIVGRHSEELDDMLLSYGEYPISENESIKASDCQIILWIKHLPHPKTDLQWQILEAILKTGQKRNLIERFTNVRSTAHSTPYYSGIERRKIKPLRTF